MARPSIVPIALTLDDRTGYTLWAPPWEEDGEEWQAFLGTSDDDAARVHLFPSPAALAAFCRTRTDHDLADHPVWPVVVGLGAADVTPDDDHRYDLDGVYDIAAEAPDRWAVEELAATIDIVSRLAECLDTTEEDEDDDQFGAVAELVARPEIGSLGLGPEAFAGRSGQDAWLGVGAALDELWEDVVEELSQHLDWTGGGTASVEDYPAAEDADDELDNDADADGDADGQRDGDTDGQRDGDTDHAAAPGGGGAAAGGAPAGGAPSSAGVGARSPGGGARPAAGSTAAAPGEAAPGAAVAGVRTISSGSRITATPAAVAAAGEFWETVGILPVEIVVPGGAGVTLRCYVQDVARFLGRDGEIFLFATPADLARYCALDERHDLSEIASWPEVVDTDTLPLPAEEDSYDLTEVSEVLAEMVAGAPSPVGQGVLVQPVDGVRDIAEYAGLSRVEELLSPSAPLGRALAGAENQPDAPLRAEDAGPLRAAWAEVVTEVSAVLVFRE